MTKRVAFSLIVGLCSTLALAEEPAFESVSSVLEHLQAQQDVQIRTEQGWTIAEDPTNMALYTFTTEGHDAHPAVFMRKVVQSDGAVSLRSWGICEAEQEPCDSLSADFEALNDRIRQEMTP